MNMDRNYQINQDSNPLNGKSPVMHLLLAGALFAILIQLTGLLIKHFDHLSVLNHLVRVSRPDRNVLILGLILILYIILWGMEIKWLKDGYKLLQKNHTETTESEEISSTTGGFNSTWQTMQNPFFEGKSQNSRFSVSNRKHRDKS